MLLIKNVNILPMTEEKVLKNQSILIRNGRIEAIESFIPRIENNTTVIDGTGKYVMPGIINMHTHLGDNQDDLMLYLVNGITTIRNMWGYEGVRFANWLFGTRLFNHLKLKRDVDQGIVEGPSIYTAGPILDGDPPVFPKFMYLHALKDRKQVQQIIKKQVNQGYDFIKIYHALSRQNFDDIIEISRHYDIPVAGHVPDLVGIKHVLESKVQSIEHLYGFINPYRPELNVKKEDIKKYAFLAAANHVWNCPTLIANERLANYDRQKEFEKEEQMQYLSKKNKKAMRTLLKASKQLYEKRGVQGNHKYMEDFYYIIGQLKNEGAGIILGTDKAVPYVVAGFSEHIEMRLLREAGLSNFEVISAATINAAKCLKKENEIGTIEKGKKADLIITQNNPFKDLQTIQRHLGVIKSGRFYSREMCDRILERLRSQKNDNIISQGDLGLGKKL